jgi:hypothetical protein
MHASGSGTFRTPRDVLLTSGMCTKADISLTHLASNRAVLVGDEIIEWLKRREKRSGVENSRKDSTQNSSRPNIHLTTALTGPC